MSELPQPDLEAARTFIARVLECNVASVSADATIETLPAWDSLGHVRILLAIEAETGRTLGSGEIARIRSVADVARTLSAAPG